MNNPVSLPLAPSNLLRRLSAGEWHDTHLLFSPSALGRWSDIPAPPPDTVALGVGYGELFAYTDAADVDRVLAIIAGGDYAWPDRGPRFCLIDGAWQPG